MVNDVFISYTSSDTEKAREVKNVLENNGYQCWMAPDSIPGGSSYASEIESAIKGCKVVVIILSERAQNSIWTAKEVSSALTYKKIVIPFHIDESVLRDPFSFYLTDNQRIEAYKNLEHAYKELCTVLRRIIGEPNNPTSQCKENHLNIYDNKKICVPYNTCWIYTTLFDEGQIAFSAETVKSDTEEKYFQYSGEIKTKITAQLEKIFSNLYQTDMIAIDYDVSEPLVRLVPASKPRWNPLSVGDEYKISFHIRYFDSDKELLYKSIHFELGKELELYIFSPTGNFLHDDAKKPYTFAQLGIDEDKLIADATELIKLCYPGKNIIVQNKFILHYYSDGSGSYILKFLLR